MDDKNKKVSKFKFVDKVEEVSLKHEDNLKENGSNEQKVNSKSNGIGIKSENKRYFSYEKRVTILVILTIILFIGSFYALYRAFHYSSDEKVTYYESSDSQYTVCLNKNSYYNQECLPSGMKYLSSIVKDIDIDYSYNVNFSSDIDYKFSYYVVANLKIYDDDSGKNVLYNNDDLLAERQVLSGESDKIDINSSVKVQYDKYLEYFNNYKKDYSLNAKGVINVLLYVDDSYDTRVVSSINIPLGEQTFSVSVNDINANKQSVSLNSNSWNNYNEISAFLGAFLSLICLMFIVKLIKYVTYSFDRKSKYESLINHILKEYDDSIVSVKDYSIDANKKLVKVLSFKELLDVRTSINKPIIYSKVNNVKSNFIVEDDSIIYKYTLKDTDDKVANK